MDPDIIVENFLPAKHPIAKKLINDHRWDGYLIYIYVCKKVANSRDGQLLTTYQALTDEMKLNVASNDKVQRIVEDYGLFSVIRDLVWLDKDAVIISNVAWGHL